MTIWETTVRTGNPAHDEQQIAQIKRMYEPQGHAVHVQPLPAPGGFHVRVVAQPHAGAAQNPPIASPYNNAHGAAGYGASGHGAPGHGASGHGASGHGAAGYGAAGYGAAGYGAPGYGAPGHGAPSGYGGSGYGAPGYGAPAGYGALGYEAPSGYAAPGGYAAQGAAGAPAGHGGPAHGHAPPANAPPAYGPPPHASADAARASHGGAPAAPYGGGAPAFAFAGVPSGAAAASSVVADAAVPLGALRVRYLRKVYGLLFISAVLGIGAGMLSISSLLGTETFPLRSGQTIEVPLIVAAMLKNPVLEYGAFGLLFVGVLGASMVSKVRGLNYVALFGVSILMGVELAPMAFVAQLLAGMGETLSANPIRDAFAMVGAIFAGLTGYVFVSRKDFSFLRATLSMGFMVVFAGCILSFVLGSEPFSLAIATVGALLSIGFLLYQTSHIFRNSNMDDPVDDALGLIVQLRNLFMFLLRIFMSRR